MKKILFLFIVSPCFLFSQGIVSEEIDLKNGEILLPGTLTYTKGLKNQALLIFVHGSGNVDRNGNQPGTAAQAGYIKTLSDSLSSNGLAFFRYDKRTATAQNLSKLENIVFADFVLDLKIVIDHFKTDDRFSSIHLIGHSQGSLTAMLGITKSVTSYISVAGASETIDQMITRQVTAQNPEMGKVVAAHFSELIETNTIANVDPLLAGMFAPQNQPFFKSWIQEDPQEAIKNVTIPTLIINGDADLQVTPEDAKALKTALPAAVLKIIPNMNHVLKEVQSQEENQKAYINPNVPLSSQLVAHILDFIKS